MRAFVGGGGPFEDPVTGSLQAGLAMWLIGSGLRAGALRRDSRHGARTRRPRLRREARQDIWIGGDCVTLVEGKVEL